MITEDEKIERLRFALNNQIEWQKYAEGKNLMLLTITAGSLLVVYNEAGFNKKDSVEIINSCSLPYLMFITTTTISFCSCLFSLQRFYNKTIFKDKITLISWDYARRKKPKDLIKDLEEYDNKHHLFDLAVQHILGSQATSRKYNRYRFGMTVYIIGILFLCGEFLFKLVSQ